MNEPAIKFHVDADDFISTMESMLQRPEMYAQNAASLEDQMHMLYMFLTSITYPRTHASHRSYQDFVFKKTKTSTTLAYHYKEIKDILPFLKEFYTIEILNLKENNVRKI